MRVCDDPDVIWPHSWTSAASAVSTCRDGHYPVAKDLIIRQADRDRHLPLDAVKMRLYIASPRSCEVKPVQTTAGPGLVFPRIGQPRLSVGSAMAVPGFRAS